MAVSDTQVATLRAYLQEDGESGSKAERVLLDRQAADSIAYGALLAAAFSEAVKRRFATRTTSWRVVKYVTSGRVLPVPRTPSTPAKRNGSSLRHSVKARLRISMERPPRG
jgi:hypothetical protein